MAMTRAYNVVDADGDIFETLNRRDDNINPTFRERRSRFVIVDNRNERPAVEGELLGNPRGNPLDLSVNAGGCADGPLNPSLGRCSEQSDSARVSRGQTGLRAMQRRKAVRCCMHRPIRRVEARLCSVPACEKRLASAEQPTWARGSRSYQPKCWDSLISEAAH
jgi:hypothetical protein